MGATIGEGHFAIQNAAAHARLADGTVQPLAEAIELVRAAPATAHAPEWYQAPVSRYHAALREDLPRLGRMADKVAEVHGGRHPELIELARVYRGLRDGLEPHLAAEEDRVFPALRRLAVEGPGAHATKSLVADRRAGSGVTVSIRSPLSP